MGSKFALIIVLARLLTPAEVGLYGLFVATVGFSMLVVGGEYYTYSQRELLSRSKERWSFVLQHQSLAIIILYTILLPAQFLIFWLGMLPWQLAGWFFALLIAEHIAQEINRLLIAMSRQLVASTVLFIRMGAWVWLLLPLMWFDPAARTLEAVFAAWLFGCLVAIVIGGVAVQREVRPWRFGTIDWDWIKQGFTVALMFLISTMSFRALQTFDRYSVELLAGADFLGVYVLYVSMAFAVVSILEPAVLSFLYPKIVSSYQQGDNLKYRQLMRELAYSIVGVSVIVAIAIAVFAPFVLVWINKPLYAQHLPILYLLLCAAVIYSFSMVPHCGLYARRADRTIVWAHVSSAAVFGAVIIAFADNDPQAATVYALITAFVWLWLVKQWRLSRLNRKGGS